MQGIGKVLGEHVIQRRRLAFKIFAQVVFHGFQWLGIVAAQSASSTTTRMGDDEIGLPSIKISMTSH